MLRVRIVLGFIGIVGLTVALGPAGYGQFGGGKGKGGGGGMFPGGGGGGQFTKGAGRDPSWMFNMAFGQDAQVGVIASAPAQFQPLLQEFALDQGIKNGQITRDQFSKFQDYLRNKVTKKMSENTPQAPGGGPAITGPQLAEIYRVADEEFRQLDLNNDQVLNVDEMPPALRQELSRWDTNKDGLIDLLEYRNFSVTRYVERFGNPNAQAANNNKNAQDSDDELEKRPVVYRAGKLPDKGLPTWFKQLDTDGDGQVALYEWRAAGRDLYEFKEWDRDDDGFITPEEAIHVYAALTKTADPLMASASPTVPNGAGTMMPGGGFRGQFGGGQFGGGFGGGKGGMQMNMFGGGKGGGQFGGGMQMPQGMFGGGQGGGKGFGGGAQPGMFGGGQGGGKGFGGGGKGFGGGQGGGNPFGGGANPSIGPGGNPGTGMFGGGQGGGKGGGGKKNRDPGQE